MGLYDDSALRAAIDLRDAYDATLSLWRTQDQTIGRMVWKTVSGQDYLYQVFGDRGNGKSLGSRSDATERSMRSFAPPKWRLSKL